MRGNVTGVLFELGEWDDALDNVEEMFASVTAARYQEPAARQIRGQILEARGNVADARDDLEKALVLSREFDDAQTLWPALIASAASLRRHGEREQSLSQLEEVVTAMQASESIGEVQEWHVELVAELREAGLVDAARQVAARMPEGVWGEAGRAVAEGSYGEAAETIEAVGNRRVPADLRVLAARSLAAEGRIGEAEAHLEAARAFYRKVGATAFLAEADAIVAAAG
jgi:tetratricopeptide (TPR) repeat protein